MTQPPDDAAPVADRPWSEGHEEGIEQAIRQFRHMFPGWWYSLGECDISCDASCGPTRASPDIALIPADDRFNAGFHIDLPQPSTLAAALREVMLDAHDARRETTRAALEPSDKGVGR